MISVDDRAGSIDLVPLLRALQVQVEVTRLEAGDCAWLGIGPDGTPVNVGVEVKTLGDALACLHSGRLAAEQIPKMVASFDHLYLMLQGEWRRRDNDGVLEEHRRNHKTGGSYWASASHGAREILWRDFESWLCSVTILSGMRLLRVQTWEEGAQYLKLLHSWYQKESHRSHQVLAQAKEVHVDHALLVKPPLARRVAAQLPGIGFSRSAAVAARFKTVVEMANAPEEAWTELVADDKRLGVRGKTIFRALRGGNGG